MGYTFERKHVETYEITHVKRDFMKYSKFHAVRKDKPKCGCCDKDFEMNDNTNLAFVKGKVNMLVCDKCANLAVEGGAEQVKW